MKFEGYRDRKQCTYNVANHKDNGNKNVGTTYVPCKKNIETLKDTFKKTLTLMWIF